MPKECRRKNKETHSENVEKIQLMVGLEPYTPGNSTAIYHLIVHQLLIKNMAVKLACKESELHRTGSGGFIFLPRELEQNVSRTATFTLLKAKTLKYGIYE
ncbi:hypothetical protein [Alishewanella longhuensis]